MIEGGGAPGPEQPTWMEAQVHRWVWWWFVFFFSFFPLFRSYGGSHSQNTNHSFFECLLGVLWRDLRGLLRVFSCIPGFLNLDPPVTFHGFVMSITEFLPYPALVPGSLVTPLSLQPRLQWGQWERLSDFSKNKLAVLLAQ